MIVNKAAKCRLYPNKDQQLKINQILGCCRYVYNKMLERQNKIYERCGAHHDRDHNAAVNIMNEGIRLLYAV